MIKKILITSVVTAMVLVGCGGSGDSAEDNIGAATVNGTISPENGYNVYGGNKKFTGAISEFKSYILLGQGTGRKTFTGSYAYYLIANDGEGSASINIDAVEGSNKEYYSTWTTSNVSNYDNISGEADNKYVTIAEQGYVLIDATGDNLTSITVFSDR